MAQQEIINIIKVNAVRFDVPQDLAVAVAQIESAFDPFAIRYEPGWKYFTDTVRYAELNMIAQQTEKILQACSFGVMQVMGAVARELGFRENLLKLSRVSVGSEYGCLKLSQLLRKYGTEEEAVSAYNAGSPRRTPENTFVNQAYVDKIFAVYTSRQGTQFS